MLWVRVRVRVSARVRIETEGTVVEQNFDRFAAVRNVDGRSRSQPDS